MRTVSECQKATEFFEKCRRSPKELCLQALWQVCCTLGSSIVLRFCHVSIVYIGRHNDPTKVRSSFLKI
jgi:hypothetical protein